MTACCVLLQASAHTEEKFLEHRIREESQEDREEVFAQQYGVGGYVRTAVASARRL